MKFIILRSTSEMDASWYLQIWHMQSILIMHRKYEKRFVIWITRNNSFVISIQVACEHEPNNKPFMLYIPQSVI